MIKPEPVGVTVAGTGPAGAGVTAWLPGPGRWPARRSGGREPDGRESARL